MSLYNSIIILGATGSGKTNLSFRLAEKFNGEIVNADSMQIYKEFNIGTAKPSYEDMKKFQHHLFDFVEPTSQYSVNLYREEAFKIIKKLIDNKKNPIIVGGTGFYINSLLNNYSYAGVAPNNEIRKKYEQFLEINGKDALYDKLKSVDYEASEKLHKNDVKRVIRALEIYETSKVNKTEHCKLDNNLNQNNCISNFNPLIIGINYNREDLYDRINRRVDIMIENGLIEEAKNLYNKYGELDIQANQAIGYKELFEAFRNNSSIDDAILKIKQNSRHYAKRQITWFKRNQNVNWFNKSEISEDEIFNTIVELYTKPTT